MDKFEKDLLSILNYLSLTAHSLCNNPEDAEDILQDTLYKVLNNKERYDTTMSLKAWSITIMRNTYYTQYRRERCVEFTTYLDCLGAESAITAKSYMAMHDILSAIRRSRRTAKGMDSLILYAKGYSYDEIAKIEKVPIGTVKSRICNARDTLRREMNT